MWLYKFDIYRITHKSYINCINILTVTVYQCLVVNNKVFVNVDF